MLRAEVIRATSPAAGKVDLDSAAIPNPRRARSSRESSPIDTQARPGAPGDAGIKKLITVKALARPGSDGGAEQVGERWLGCEEEPRPDRHLRVAVPLAPRTRHGPRGHARPAGGPGHTSRKTSAEGHRVRPTSEPLPIKEKVVPFIRGDMNAAGWPGSGSGKRRR